MAVGLLSKAWAYGRDMFWAPDRSRDFTCYEPDRRRMLAQAYLSDLETRYSDAIVRPQINEPAFDRNLMTGDWVQKLDLSGLQPGRQHIIDPVGNYLFTADVTKRSDGSTTAEGPAPWSDSHIISIVHCADGSKIHTERDMQNAVTNTQFYDPRGRKMMQYSSSNQGSNLEEYGSQLNPQEPHYSEQRDRDGRVLHAKAIDCWNTNNWTEIWLSYYLSGNLQTLQSQVSEHGLCTPQRFDFPDRADASQEGLNYAVQELRKYGR